jgi:hypothetical protein
MVENVGPSFAGFKPGADWMVAGGNVSILDLGARILYLQPQLAGMPQGVTSAELRIYKNTVPPNPSWSYGIVVYPIETPWSATTFYGTGGWNIRPSYNGSSMLIQNYLSGSLLGWFTLDFSWIWNNYFPMSNNYGFVIFTNATWLSGSTPFDMCGPGYSNSTLRPIMRVTKDGQTVDFLIVEM